MKRPTSASLLLSLVTGMLVLVLVTVFSLSALDAWRRERNTWRVLSSARIARDIVLVRETVRAELGLIDTSIADPKPITPEHLRQLKDTHRQTMAALHFVQEEMARSGNSKISPRITSQLRMEVVQFDSHLFPAILAAAQGPRAQRSHNLIYDPLSASTSILHLIDEQAALLSRDIASSGPFLGEMMHISDIAWHVRVDAGQERRVMANMIAAGTPPTQDQLLHFARVSGRMEAPWQTIEQSLRAGVVPNRLAQAIIGADRGYFGRYLSMHQRIVNDLSQGRDPHVGDRQWLAMSTPALDSLMQVSRAALDAAEVRADENLAREKRDLALALALMVLSIGLASFAVVIVRSRVIRPLNAITRAMTSGADADIEAALALRARTDEIGLFARALKAQRQGMAERQRLEAAREAAETASRIKSEFLANMSHELRTPLNAVIGFSEVMLHKTFGPLSERYAEYAGLINDAGTHLLSLVSDILDLAKIEAGRFAPDFRVFDLKPSVQHCLALVRRRADERNITVRADLPDGDLMVEADARALKQILLNLLSNAVKFSRQDGLISLALSLPRDDLEIRVKDEGIGIPADVLARIGQPFEQASNNPMLAREGTGLGLALVKALAVEHGGSLTVISQENVGTEITVVLPRRQVATRAANAAA
ncbi:MAG TPA: HAMP domain-containing sensor histidine kinase [Rhizomicrobium sp.]|nr:HAMP domain-containing sensor histidine kinase [Rhizomicrobium sp.]